MYIRYVILSYLIFSSTCFALKPDEMAPNTWYDMVPAGQSVFDVLADPRAIWFFLWTLGRFSQCATQKYG